MKYSSIFVKTEEKFQVRFSNVSTEVSALYILQASGIVGYTGCVVSLSSFLLLRSYIFDLVTLELRVLTNKGHFKGVSELLDNLLLSARLAGHPRASLILFSH